MSTARALSVIVCSHNPRRDYLARTIAGLRAQTTDPASWDLVVIDNASQEPLDKLIDLSWHPMARIVREPRLGLTHARLRGIAEASGDLLVFVDDDNVLDASFLASAMSVAARWPIIGAWSGQTRPEFETPPPEWTRRYWGALVIREVSEDRWSNVAMLPETMPCGAGLCVRRSVADRYVALHLEGQRPFLLDRAGDSLASAGDNDLAACACDIGMGVGVFAELQLTHLIPSGRLEESYLLRLIEGIEYSAVLLRSLRGIATPSPFLLRTRIANVLRRLMLNGRDRRFFSAVQRGRKRAWLQLQSVPRLPAVQPAARAAAPHTLG